MLVLKEKSITETWVETTAPDVPPPLPSPPGPHKFVQAFTAAVAVQIPGTLHGLGTADLILQFYNEVGEHLPVGTLAVDRETYDVHFTLLKMQSGRVVLMA